MRVTCASSTSNPVSSSVVAYLVIGAFTVSTACTAVPSERPGGKDPVAIEATTQPMDLVDLRVYLRHGKGEDAHLVPTIRQVPVSDDLPRTALQLLIDGPVAADPPGLVVTLPRETRIRRFTLDNSTAVVDFSSAIMRGATAMSRHARHEFLALSAIANTLTEFPDIDYVRVTVDGRRGGPFWGGWGLPEVLVRDEELLEPPSKRLRIAEPGAFHRRPQRTGMVPARPVRVTALRVDPTATYLRVAAEVAATNGRRLLGPVPLSTARRHGDRIVLQVGARGPAKLAGSLRGKFDDPAFKAAQVRLHHKKGTVAVRLTPRRPGAFWLHTLNDPARVVLDIRR
ncbi:MAG: hypothetical protein GEU74_06495 [Nitriliruptorales bacterium]|nr:hypothetical protein [Nitriliruptorales bacterium]